MKNELLVTNNHPLTAGDIRGQVNLIQQVMNDIMKKDVHYGIIPGTKKPTLYKPGSEKILATFRIAVIPEVRDLSDGDQIRYLVQVKGVLPDGSVVGVGIGECSTNEEKYKWRRAVCEEEFEAAPENRKRIKYSSWQRKTTTVQQIRTEPADMANTVLKMAKKRAQIDLTLTATGASDVFDQDIEDLPPEYVEEMFSGNQSLDERIYKGQSTKPSAEDKFTKNLPAWRDCILQRKKTATELIAFIEGKGTTLTSEQKTTLRNIEKGMEQ